MYGCDWWKLYKIDKIVKQHLRESLRYNMPLREEKLLESNLEVYLVMFNVILKNPRMCETLLKTFHPSSRRLLLVEMTFVHLWENMLRKKELWFNQRNCWYQAIFGEWNNHYTVTALLSVLGAVLQNNLSFCALHSIEVLQQLCWTCDEC